MSKILDNAVVLWHRIVPTADAASGISPKPSKVSSGDLAVVKFPYCFADVTSAEMYLLKALKFNCSQIPRPDQVYPLPDHDLDIFF